MKGEEMIKETRERKLKKGKEKKDDRRQK